MIMKYYDWMCLCYDKLTWRDTATKLLIVLTILFYPFMFFPIGPFFKLSFYPLIGIFLLNFDRFLILWWKNKYIRFMIIMGGLWVLWMVVASCFSVGFHNIDNKDISYIVGSIINFIPACIFFMGISLYSFDEMKRLFFWSFLGLFIYMAVYTGIELLYFSKNVWAKDFLRNVFPLFTKIDGRLFWDEERCRSLFIEPAYYAVILTYSIFLFSYFAWTSKKNLVFILNLLLVILAIFLLYTTRSAIGALSLMGGTFMWLIFGSAQIMKMQWASRIKMFIFIILCACASIILVKTQHHPMGNLTKSMGAINVSQPVVKPNVSQPVVKPNVSQPVVKPNVSQPMVKPSVKQKKAVRISRSIHLVAELNLIKESPIYGHGPNAYSECMIDALLEENKVDHVREINIWARNGRVPTLCSYTAECVRFGSVGLLLFLAWFLLPIIVFWFKRYKLMSVEGRCFSAILTSSILISMLTVSFSFFSYMILMGFTFLVVTNEKT